MILLLLAPVSSRLSPLLITSVSWRISSIRYVLPPRVPPHHHSRRRSASSVPFEFCTEEDIRKIIGASPSKCCDLDPVPTFLVKDYLDTLLPFITRLCNASIREACLPATQKKAIITPVIKKVGADVDDVKNYRPISGLTFLSKVIEKVVAKQLVGYLHSNNLLPKFQSGFRRGYSTETAILRMLSDIYAAVDRGRVALLALLDVSAAFDTVDHDILLERLLVSFGVTGSAHAWIRSFLSSRSQSVRLGSSSSSWSSIRCGVPQGLILGPLLYILYTADVEPNSRILRARCAAVRRRYSTLW